MAREKKLQVFVSSTYADLRDERQAAVEAILSAGHIPAGMELFAAGDQSQMHTIRRWIDESDVFLLILGGRYGSIDPATGKSYIHLEYEYALAQGKPLFAVVIDDAHLEERVRARGSAVLERESHAKFQDFRAFVLSKVVRFWKDPRDIKLAIHETMAEYDRREELKGWVAGDGAVDTARLADELARLTKENAELRVQIVAQHRGSGTYDGLSFEQMYSLLASEAIGADTPEPVVTQLAEVARGLGDSRASLLHAFWHFRDHFGTTRPIDNDSKSLLKRLERLGFTRRGTLYGPGATYNLTELGHRFMLRLRVERLGAVRETDGTLGS